MMAHLFKSSQQQRYPIVNLDNVDYINFVDEDNFLTFHMLSGGKVEWSYENNGNFSHDKQRLESLANKLQ